MLELREMTSADDKSVAALIRHSLKQHGLDIPGTVYFDKELDYLSRFYGHRGRNYFVLESGYSLKCELYLRAIHILANQESD